MEAGTLDQDQIKLALFDGLFAAARSAVNYVPGCTDDLILRIQECELQLGIARQCQVCDGFVLTPGRLQAVPDVVNGVLTDVLMCATCAGSRQRQEERLARKRALRAEGRFC